MKSRLILLNVMTLLFLSPLLLSAQAAGAAGLSVITPETSAPPAATAAPVLEPSSGFFISAQSGIGSLGNEWINPVGRLKAAYNSNSNFIIGLYGSFLLLTEKDISHGHGRHGAQHDRRANNYGYGYHNDYESDYDNYAGTSGSLLNYGGGLFFSFSSATGGEKLFSLALPVYLGAGGNVLIGDDGSNAASDRNNNNYDQDDYYHYYDNDYYSNGADSYGSKYRLGFESLHFTIEPGLQTRIHMTDFISLSLGGAYRFAFSPQLFTGLFADKSAWEPLLLDMWGYTLMLGLDIGI